MDIKVTLKLEGLEPLASAINALAAAYTGSNAVIEKAKTSSKKAAEPKAVEDSKPVDTPPAAVTEPTTEAQAPAAAETVQESPSDAPAISDEQLRAAAATAAKKDRAKVQAIVAKYAPNVSGIAQQDRAKAIEELAAV